MRTVERVQKTSSESTDSWLVHQDHLRRVCTCMVKAEWCCPGQIYSQIIEISLDKNCASDSIFQTGDIPIFLTHHFLIMIRKSVTYLGLINKGRQRLFRFCFARLVPLVLTVTWKITHVCSCQTARLVRCNVSKLVLCGVHFAFWPCIRRRRYQ